MVINGDGLTEMKKMDSESVGLVYLDPPFFTQCRQTLKDKNLNEHSFDDQWAGGIETCKSFMKERLSECQRILKKTGSIFLHCDRYASHHLRIILD